MSVNHIGKIVCHTFPRDLAPFLSTESEDPAVLIQVTSLNSDGSVTAYAFFSIHVTLYFFSKKVEMSTFFKIGREGLIVSATPEPQLEQKKQP